MSTVYNNREYTTYLYARKAKEVIKNHDPRKVKRRVAAQYVLKSKVDIWRYLFPGAPYTNMD